jgi:hypothetical protein
VASRVGALAEQSVVGDVVPTANAIPLEQLRVTSRGIESRVGACVETIMWIPRLRPSFTISTSSLEISLP